MTIFLLTWLSVVSLITGAENVSDRRILFAGEGAKKVMILRENGGIEWEYPAEMSRDAWCLPDGNILFCYNNQYNSGKNDNPSGVMEVTVEKKVVFDYRTTGQVWSCQRLADGNTMVGAASQGKLLIVSPEGNVVKEVVLKSKGGHSCIRNARQTSTGTFLVAEESAHAVREYSADGSMIREMKVNFPPYSVVRTGNGNTIVCGQRAMVELDKGGKVIWSLADSDIAEMGVRWFAGMQVLPSGNILVCNAGGKVPFFEVTKDKKIAWRWDKAGQSPLIGHGIQLLDVPGIPLK